MKKKVIKLTEAQLDRLIRVELKKLNEHIKIGDFEFDPENNIHDKRELEDLERQNEGKLSFKDIFYLSAWLMNNPEIMKKNIEHDELENKKIPRLRYSSLNAFANIISDNITIKNKQIYGFNEATKKLSEFFDIDETLSKIELGTLIEYRLKYLIIN